MKRFSFLFVAVMTGALLIATSVSALVLNGNFEAGSFGSWTKSSFINNGFSSAAGAGGTDLTTIVGGPAVAPLSISDPRSNNVIQYPGYGHYSAKVNDERSYTTGGYARNANRITQDIAAYIDPTDSLSHTKFAYAAVMVNPASHTPNEKPYFRVRAINTSNSNDVLYDFTSYVDEPGKNWMDGAAFGGGESWKYLNWQVVDLTPTPAHPVNTGDIVRIEVTAAGCSLGGHPGYVYVDEITDNEIAGPTIKATGPATVLSNSAITYNYNYRNGAASVINPTVSVTQPAGVTFTSVSDNTNCSLSGGTVTCNFTGMAPVSNDNFTITGNVTAPGGTQLAHGNYTIGATGFPTVGGQTVLTNVLSQPTTTSVVSSLNPSIYGENVTFTATVAANPGPGTPTGNVQFVVDGVNFGAPVALSGGGTAQISTAALPVGTHPVTANFLGGPGFDTSSGILAGGQRVNQATTSTSVSAPNSSYGQNVTFTATVTVVGPGAGTPGGTVNFFDGVNPIAGCQNVPVNGAGQAPCSIATLPAGGHTITAAYSGNGNFSGGGASASQTVSKVDLSVTASSHTVTYGDAAPAVAPTYSGFVLSEGPANLTTQPTCSTLYSAGSTVAGSPYSTTCAGGVSNNYNFVVTNGTVTVNKAPLSVTASSHTVTYGDAAPGITPTYSGFVLSQGPGSLTTAPSCSTVYASGSSASGSPYQTSCSGGVSGNYAFSYTNGAVAVNKAPLTVTASSHSVAFGDAVPSVTPSYSGFVLSQGPGSLTTAPSCSTTYTTGSSVAGSPYPTSCSGGVSGNYSFSYANGAVTMAKAMLTVTASSHNVTYGDAVPAVTPSYSGFLLGQGPADLATAPACVTAYVVGSNVAGSPYSTSCSGGASGNYDFTYNSGTVGVSKSTLTVTASGVTVTYGDAAPAITPGYAGFLLGQGPANLGTQPSCVTAYSSGSPVANYGSSCSGGVSGNYAFSYVGGTVAVNKAQLNVTASSHTVIFGDAVPAITPSYTGFVLSQGPGSLTTVPTCSTTYTVGSSVAGSPYQTSCAGGVSGNYAFSYVDGAVNMNKTTLTITASSHNVTYGDAVPTVTPSYSGFLLGQGPADLATAPTCVTAYVVGSSVAGSPYSTSCSGAVSGNYDFVYVNGTVSVAKSVLTVTASSANVTYGDDAPVITPGYAGFLLGQGPANLATQPSCVTIYVPGSPVAGSPYTTSCSGAAAGNYSFVYQGGQVMVAKKNLTVTAENKTRTYGSPNPVFTATFDGFVLGQTRATSGVMGEPGLTTLATQTSPVDGSPFQITATMGSLNSSNYSFTLVNGQLTIEKAVLTVTANNFSRVYGSANPALTAQFTGLVNGETYQTSGVTGSADLVTAAAQSSNVGQYPIAASAGTLTAINYSFVFVNGTLTITKAHTETAIINPTDLTTITRVGQPYPVTWATVPIAPGSGTLTGNVTVSDGTGDSCTAPIAAGMCTITSSVPGKKAMVATYEGDDNFFDSSSLISFHTVVLLVGGNVKQQMPFGDPVNLAAVTVTVTGSITGETTTDANGNYSFASLIPNGNYTVRPSGLGLNYDPSSRTYANVSTNILDANFIAHTGPVIIPTPTPNETPSPSPTPNTTPTPSASPTPNPSPSPTPGQTGIGGEGDVVDANGNATGGDGVKANDLEAIRTFALGNTTPEAGSNQFQRGDTAPRDSSTNLFGNGKIDSADVTVARLYSMGLLPDTTAAGPVLPEVVPTPADTAFTPRVVRPVNVGANPGETVAVQFQMNSQGNESSASFTVAYNQSVLSNPVVTIGNGVSEGTILGTNTSRISEGKIGVLVDSVTAYDAGVRQVVVIRFDVASNAQLGLYPVTLGDGPTDKSVSSNSGNLLSTRYEVGYVQIGSTASGVSLSGRVTTSTGQGLRNAAVVISDQFGNRRTTTTGSFGHYRFDDVEVGATYVVTISSRRYRFSPRIVNVTDNVADLDFVGLE